MPGKRPLKRGSFDGHFDELVKQFPEERPKPRPGKHKAGAKAHDHGCVHDRLFESAWSKAHGTRHHPAR